MSCFDYTTETNTKFIEPSRNENIGDLIQNLKAETDEFEETKDIPDEVDAYQDLFYCWVTPTNYQHSANDPANQNENSQSKLSNDRILPSSVFNQEKFIFQFYLWINHCRYQFKFGWTELNNFCKKKKYQLCFVDKSWPKWYLNPSDKTVEQINKILDHLDENVETKEFICKNLENEMNKMKTLGKYMTFDANDIGEGSGRESNWSWNRKKRKATEKHASCAAYVLCKIFNCPKLVLTADFFEYFNEFEDEMKKLLPILAHNSIQHLRYIGYNWCDPHDVHYKCDLKLIEENKFWKHKGGYKNLFRIRKDRLTEYHHVYVMIKELKSFHWALKFVGINKLLTIEYLNNDRVRVQLLENNAMNQRIFWYGNASHFEECEFTKRWNVIHKQRLDPMISGGQIGHWIDFWIKKYPKYHPLTNNCQHFVRDIMSAIDYNAGKILIRKMQRLKVSRSIWPSNIKKQEVQRTTEISKELKLYGMFQKCISECKKKSDEEDLEDKKDQDPEIKWMNYFNQIKQSDIQQLREFDDTQLIEIPMNEEKDRRMYCKYSYLLNDPVL